MTSSLPTTGMLFSAWQATTQALQPTQAFMSIVMPQACGSLKASGPPSRFFGVVYGDGNNCSGNSFSLWRCGACGFLR